MTVDYVIVGAGLFGSVLAERIASVLKKEVVVVERREHIGGNCYSEIDSETGIEFHKYGPHTFHTSNQKVWNYINRFTQFNNFSFRVLSEYKNHKYQMPINLSTINEFYGKNFTPEEAREFILSEACKAKISEPKNLEEKAISLIGEPLYQAFIKNYTQKHWDKNPADLPASIIARLPVSFNYNAGYFHNCKWQGIPIDGYTKVFENLLTDPKIKLELGTDYFQNKDKFKARQKIIFTGPIDRFYDYRFGKLEWRSIKHEKTCLNVKDQQGNVVINYPEAKFKHTRIIEPKHFHPERQSLLELEKTIIFHEYSLQDNDNPYYPINTAKNKSIYQKYQKLAKAERNVIIGGRLGNYVYIDMDQTIALALKAFKKFPQNSQLNR